MQNQIVVEWVPGFNHYQLQQTSDLNQPWQNVGGQTLLTGATNAIIDRVQFFRVIGFTK